MDEENRYPWLDSRWADDSTAWASLSEKAELGVRLARVARDQNLSLRQLAFTTFGGSTSFTPRQVQSAVARARVELTRPPRACVGCGGDLAPAFRADARHHDDTCRKRAERKRARARELAAVGSSIAHRN